DILRLTPAHMMAHTYCLNEQQWKQAVSPIQSTTVIGPPSNCNQNRETKNYPTQPLAQ
ncbi:cupin domain-containing protein, partial [Bacillus cereus]|nr:cupin domain-containing protein [Bacillus cereus]